MGEDTAFNLGIMWGKAVAKVAVNRNPDDIIGEACSLDERLRGKESFMKFRRLVNRIEGGWGDFNDGVGEGIREYMSRLERISESRYVSR